jgi:hypothetical protein
MLARGYRRRLSAGSAFTLTGVFPGAEVVVEVAAGARATRSDRPGTDANRGGEEPAEKLA